MSDTSKEQVGIRELSPVERILSATMPAVVTHRARNLTFTSFPNIALNPSCIFKV
jgi:hypothetical protein